jgi:hypothetical protein
MSSNNNEIQNLFTIFLDSILTKVSNSYKIKLDELKGSIGTITFTENISDSINSFCSILNPLEVPKPKRVLKKSIPLVEASTQAPTDTGVTVDAPKPKKVLKKAITAVETPKEPEVSVEAPKEPEVNVEAPKPKKVLKKAVPIIETPNEPEVVAQAAKEPEVNVEAPKPKKVLKKAVPIIETPNEPEVVAQATKEPEVSVEAPKPKKVLKKAVPLAQAPEVNVQAPNEPEVSVEAPKPKKVLKKAVPLVEPPKEPEVNVQEPEVVTEEPEVKIKPKKIIVKRPVIEPATIPAPQKKSIKEVDIVEYGSDEQHDENATVYDSIQMYEDDLLEPREINGVKYLIDSSEYIYDMETQELLGKLSEKDKSTILFLKNFTE